MPNRDTFPSEQELMDATVEALESLGRTSILKIAPKVAGLLDLSSEVLEMPTTNPNDPRTNFQYRLAWARTILKNQGILRNPEHGIWELTSKQESIQLAALSQITRLSQYWNWAVPWREIEKGFLAGGEKFQYADRNQGIFKPQGMDAALSIKTSVKRIEPCWHQDPELGELTLPESSESFDLNLGRQEIPNSEFLKIAIDRRMPLIYFHGIAHDWYQPLAPVWGTNIEESVISLSTEKPDDELDAPPGGIVPSYSMTVHKSRNHQARFSTKVREAYGWKCALSGLPVHELLVGCHIIPDAEGGEASIKNGISMSTLHHSAFDRNLIGIDANFKVHISPTLMSQSDGEVLEGLKKLEGENLELPERSEDSPDKVFLEYRFNAFKSTF